MHRVSHAGSLLPFPPPHTLLPHLCPSLPPSAQPLLSSPRPLPVLSAAPSCAVAVTVAVLIADPEPAAAPAPRRPPFRTLPWTAAAAAVTKTTSPTVHPLHLRYDRGGARDPGPVPVPVWCLALVGCHPPAYHHPLDPPHHLVAGGGPRGAGLGRDLGSSAVGLAVRVRLYRGVPEPHVHHAQVVRGVSFQRGPFQCPCPGGPFHQNPSQGVSCPGGPFHHTPSQGVPFPLLQVLSPSPSHHVHHVHGRAGGGAFLRAQKGLGRRNMVVMKDGDKEAEG